MHLAEFRRILRQAFLLPILALVALAGVLLWQTITTRRAQYAVDSSDRIRTHIAELERLIIDQETSLDSYQLTSDPENLNAFRTVSGPIDRHFSGLHELMAGNTGQLGNLAQAHDRYLLWLGYAQQALSPSFLAPSAFMQQQQVRQGDELMRSLRTALLTMAHTEDHTRKQRMEEAAALERQEEIVIVAGALLVGLLLSTISWNRLRRVSQAYHSSLDELQHQAQEVHESREWLQTTLRSIGDAVIVCGTDGAIQFMNPVAEELTEYSMEEAHSLPLQKVFRVLDESTRQEMETPVAEVIRRNKVTGRISRATLVAHSGREFVISDSAAPIHDKEGSLIGIVLVFRDITDECRKEAALVANEKLAIAGRLAASIAHEIHNPLDSVSNLLYLLAREPDSVRRAEYITMAQQELGRTLQISRTLLNLYREPAAPVSINMAELLESVLLLLHRRLTNQQIQVEHNFQGSFVVEGFPAELRQVFTNLIVNAADAAGPGGTIRIAMAGIPAQEFQRAGIEVEIADSGPGIPDGVRDKLFQPFFTTKGEKGTGLGLWVSLGIVQKHGGSIRVRDHATDGLSGASIRVYLPVQTLATSKSRATAFAG